MPGGSSAVVARLRNTLLSFTAAFNDALGELDEFMLPVEATELRIDQARALLSVGDRAMATDVLVAAHSSATRHELHDLVAAIEELARRAQLPIGGGHRSVDGDRVLSERELDVVVLLKDGLTNPEIAAALHISLSTARAHVSSILDKLGAASRTEAVSVAHRRGIV